MASNNKLAAKAAKLQEMGKIDDAIKLYNAILTSNPKDLQSLFALALIFGHRNDHAKAIALADRFIAINQTNDNTWLIRATSLSALNRYDEALESYQRALQINPNNLNTLLSLGLFYFEKKQMYGLAIDTWERLLKIKPDHAAALINRGALLFQMGEHELSANTYGYLLKMHPNYEYVLGLYCNAKMHCCDWNYYPELCAHIIEGIRANKRVCRTLPFMAISDSLEDHLKCAEIFAQNVCPQKNQRLWQGKKYQHDRIRVAYISADFREHPVGQSMIGVIERHDKTKFETIGMTLSSMADSAICRRYLKAFERFIDIRGMSPLTAANLIRSLEADIIVDLGGYTAGANPDIYTYHPAPVQVNYLGYPGTMASNFMDYILVDKHLIPEESKQYYSEKVAYLPDTYFPPNTDTVIAERTPTREESGLPANGFVFCSFSNDFKITPQMFTLWMRILSSVEGSVLWLMSRNKSTQQNLRREAAQRGVDPDRLFFASRIPLHSDHLARYRLANLFLDTNPYGAHTTATDALRVGVPVITCMGNTFASRVAGSLLHAIGLPELITTSFDDYAALAIKLASDEELLNNIKTKLIANQSTHALFDADRFVRGIEEAFISMTSQVKTT